MADTLIEKLKAQRELGGHVPLIWREAMTKAIELIERHCADPAVVETVAMEISWHEWDAPILDAKPSGIRTTLREQHLKKAQAAIAALLGQKE